MPKMSFVKCKQLRININGSNAATKYIKQATATTTTTTTENQQQQQKPKTTLKSVGAKPTDRAANYQQQELCNFSAKQDKCNNNCNWTRIEIGMGIWYKESRGKN